MKPRNNKALYHSVGGIFDKLYKQYGCKEEDLSTEDLMGIDLALKASQQMMNMTVNEHNRAKVKMQITEHNKMFGDAVELREIEGKAFDNTIE